MSLWVTLKNPLGRTGRLLNRLQGVDYGILGMEINIGMVKKRNGNQYIVFAFDSFTKYLEGVATISFDALISAMFIFNMVFCRHGPCEKVLTDRGEKF